MSAATYTPREGSVAWKVIQFLQANRDEQLDADLISAKCDCVRANVHTLLGPAVQAGLLVRTEDVPSGELVYSAGSGAALPPEQPTASPFHAWLERRGQDSAEGRPQRHLPRPTNAPAPAPAKRAPAAPFRIDVGTVQIDKNVPLPGRRQPMDWTPLLGKLEVGDSFLLPAAAKSAIGSAVKVHKDATGMQLTTRTVDGGIRVWRVA